MNRFLAFRTGLINQQMDKEAGRLPMSRHLRDVWDSFRSSTGTHNFGTCRISLDPDTLMEYEEDGDKNDV